MSSMVRLASGVGFITKSIGRGVPALAILTMFSLVLSGGMPIAAAEVGVNEAAPTATEGQEIFNKAWDVWIGQARPTYLQFTMPCHDLGRTRTCGSSTRMIVTIRSADGQAHVDAVDANAGSSHVLLDGGYIYGPAFAPLSFVQRTKSAAPSAPTEPILFDDGIKVIGSVKARPHYYDSTLVGRESFNGNDVFRLRLVPLGDPDLYPLRQLIVDANTYRVRQLDYQQSFRKGSAKITYDFSPVGDDATWCITKITANVPIRSLLGTSYVSSIQEMSDVKLLQSVPDDYFKT